MKSRFIILMLIFLQFFFRNAYSQDCSIYVDTFYVVSIDYLTKGFSPSQGMILANNLDEVSLKKKSVEEFNCNFYKSGDFLLAPPLEYESNLIRCYGDSAAVIYNQEYNTFLKKLECLNKKSERLYFKIEDNIKVRLRISRAVCSVWEIPIAIESFNELTSSQILADNECLKDKKSYFVIKSINQVFDLNKQDLETIKQKID